jgi:hypothetical protein
MKGEQLSFDANRSGFVTYDALPKAKFSYISDISTTADTIITAGTSKKFLEEFNVP